MVLNRYYLIRLVDHSKLALILRFWSVLEVLYVLRYDFSVYYQISLQSGTTCTKLTSSGNMFNVGERVFNNNLFLSYATSI